MRRDIITTNLNKMNAKVTFALIATANAALINSRADAEGTFGIIDMGAFRIDQIEKSIEEAELERAVEAAGGWDAYNRKMQGLDLKYEYLVDWMGEECKKTWYGVNAKVFGGRGGSQMNRTKYYGI